MKSHSMQEAPRRITRVPNAIRPLVLNLAACCGSSLAVAQDLPAKSPLGAAMEKDQADKAAGKEDEKTVVDEFHETYIGPDDRARVAFLPPKGSKSISKTGRLWVDAKNRCVVIDGYVAMREGALEMFACPVGTKEHESIVAAIGKSREVHAGLLAVKAKSGTPVKFLPDFAPPSGQEIRVWVCWRDSGGKFHAVDARKWVLRNGTLDKEMEAEWVFAGSGFWKDPADGREYYRADGGDMICVSNFTTAMMDVNISSSAQAGALAYIPFVDRIPERGTSVRLVLSPIPVASKQPDKAESTEPDPTNVNPAKAGAGEKQAQKNAPAFSVDPPTEEILPVNPRAKADLKDLLMRRNKESQ